VIQYISVSAAARYLKCSAETVRRYLESGKLEGFQPGGRGGWWRVELESVLKKVHKLHKHNIHVLRERVVSACPPVV